MPPLPPSRLNKKSQASPTLVANEILHDVLRTCSDPEIRRNEKSEKRLIQLIDDEIENAVIYNTESSLLILHIIANEILRRRYNAIPDAVELSPFAFIIQQKIMQAQLDYDLRALSGGALPSNEHEFKTWFNNKFQKHHTSCHSLFDYIEKSASIEEFRYFIKIEAEVHVSFDDVIAATQIGVRGQKKLEFSANYNDELGNNDPQNFHLTMFERLIETLGIVGVASSDILWQALACGNYMMYLAHFRKHYHHCAGYLGYLEALTPIRFASIAKGGERLGIPSKALAYHSEHSVLDAMHAESWLENIILAEIRERPDSIHELAQGVLLRERVSNRYWDAILDIYAKQNI
jgi:hypothetical protein